VRKSCSLDGLKQADARRQRRLSCRSGLTCRFLLAWGTWAAPTIDQSGAGGSGAPPTEMGPALGACGFLRSAMTAGRGRPAGGAELEFWIGRDAGAVAAAFRNPLTFATKSATWTDNFSRSTFWASRFVVAEWMESAVCRCKLSKSTRLTDLSPLAASVELVAGASASTARTRSA
jgi:hypothetical protein